MVVKSDRRRQELDPAKLLRSIQVACAKRPVSAEIIERMVEQIDAEVRSRDLPEVQSSSLGDLVMQKLREIDQVAYIRFASVYRAFADVSSFQDELRRLNDHEEPSGAGRRQARGARRGGRPARSEEQRTPAASGTGPVPS